MLKKIYIIVIFIFLLISCNQQNTSNKESTKETKNLDWLVGFWTRTNDKANKQTFEYWNKNTNSEYTGLGITLEGADTTFREDLMIVHNGENWIYEVRGVNEDMTQFVFTELTHSSFECKNEKNEFPKKISYKRVNDTLFAKISADDVSIEFNFVREQK